MIAVAHKDLVRAMGRRRTSRLRRALLAATLLALCVLFCLFGAIASAGAVTPGFSAQALLAQHALPASPLTAAELFTPFGISPTQLAVKGATPGKPIARSPRGTITTTKPTFKWSKVAGATRYELRVYKGGKLLLKKAGLKKLSWKSSKALPLNVSLKWKVRAGNALGAGAWSKSFRFKIVNPYAPRGTITTTKPTFKWSKVAGATRYELRVYKGRKLLLKKTGLKKRSWKSSKALPMYVSLTWKVRGSKARRAGAWSKRFAFEIVGIATQIALKAGNAQTAVAGTAVATAPSVIVKDANNNPVSGVNVTFAVARGGGSLTSASAATNASGIATVGSWTLGTTAGANTLTATSTGLSGSPVTFSATGRAGAAKQIALKAGNAQTAVAGTAVATAPSVIVKDANNNPVSGVNVTFAVARGGGSLTSASAATNASGIATVGSWTLGTTAGANTLTATSTGLSGSPVTFSATGRAGAAKQIALKAGNAQTAVAGTAVATAPSVIVKDANNNPVSGVNVTFAVARGGGSLTSASAATNASGIATVGSWTLGTTAGANTLTATSTGLSGSPVTFSATGRAGAAKQIALKAGNAQTAVAGTAVATAPSVIVKDANNNPVSGVNVTFAVARGGGSLTSASAATNASGIATVGSWTLGTTAGANTLTATSTGLSGSPVTFSATGRAGAMAKFALTLAGAQSSGAAFSGVNTLTAEDAYGNTVTTYSALTNNVTLSVAPSDGTISGLGLELNNVLDQSLDFTNGVANLTGKLVFTGVTGDHTFTATSQIGGYTGTSASVTISAGAATKGVLTTQPSGAVNGVALSGAPVVQLRDSGNNNVSSAGVSVVATIASGAGTLSGTTTVATNASGVATFSNLVITGTVGSYTLTFTPTALTAATSGSFTLTAGAATRSLLHAGDAQTAVATAWP